MAVSKNRKKKNYRTTKNKSTKTQKSIRGRNTELSTQMNEQLLPTNYLTDEYKAYNPFEHYLNGINFNTINRIKMKCFWNGTIMFETELNKERFYKIIESFRGDIFLINDFSVDEAIANLNKIENKYASEYQRNGSYNIDINSSTFHLYTITSLIKRGVIKNDNNYGLLTIGMAA